MRVRIANKFDIPAIKNLLGKYSNATPIDLLKGNDLVKAEKIITHILAGAGVILLAEKDNIPVGFIMGLISENIWDSKILTLNELAYYVDVEYRGGTAGYRLISEYNRIAKEFYDNGRINLWTISKMSTSPNLSFERFGFRKIEETWSQGD
jgi:N-acetylglutamate synthase-like GNAT family acetyltransferase